MTESPTNAKFARFADLLYEKTIEGKLEWEEASEGEYRASIKKNNVVLAIYNTGNGPDVTVSIFNELGRMVDSFTDVTICDYSPHQVGFDTYFKLMTELHVVAGRQANGADKVLDSLISELDDEIPF